MLCPFVSCPSRLSVPFVAGLLLSSALLGLLPFPVQADQSIALAWNSSADTTNAVGYKIYYGPASHHYTQSMDVGNVTNAVITVPATGTIYFFAATTYGRTGVESAFSNETSFSVPAAASLTAAGLAAGQFSFLVTGTPGARYAVEASTNLVDWFSVQTNTAPFVYADARPAKAGQCFYRTVAL